MSKFPGHDVEYLLDSYPRLFFIHSPNIPFSIASFWLRAGSRFETEDKAGLAHLLEHIFMKRTNRFPDISTRLQQIEGRGILYGAFTSQDPVYYYTIQEPKRIVEGYETLHEGFYHSIIEEEDIKSAKEPVIDELKKSERNPSSVLWYLANKGLWPNSSLSHKPLGSENTVQSIKYDDIIDFQKKYYGNNNLTVLVISPDKNNFKLIMDKIEPSKEKSKPNILDEKFAYPRNQVLRDKTSNFVQIAVSFCTKGNKTGEEVAALRLIKNYLAGGWISRLNQRLRVEKNITYRVNGFIKDFPDTGMMRFTFSTRKQNLNNALKIIKEELHILKNSNLSKPELEAHKNASRIGILTHSLKRESLLLHYGWSSVVYSHTPTPLQKFIKNIDELDSKTIKRIANKHLDEMSIVGVGDINEDDLQP